MSKITKKELRQRCIDNETAIARLELILKENGIERQPQLKQLDQSVFDGLDEKWRFAAVDLDGESWVYREQPKIDKGDDRWSASNTPPNSIGTGYDASNWQNSLIERDIAKELLEVDLSSELTGSDLAKDYFKRGCCPRVCFVGEDDDECLSDLMVAMVIGYVEGKGFETSYHDFFPCAAMINSYGDELKASQVGS